MIIVGVDEVGRGCWAGPLVAGAVALRGVIPGLADSKKLSAKRRQSLNTLIYQQADCGLGWVTPSEVDQLGLTAAVRAAMERAVAALSQRYDEIIIDGNYNFLAQLPGTRALIKADDTVPAVSAASIIAKVARDTFMTEQAALFPAYGFEKHVGYGTSLHIAALQQYGPCKIHRMSYKPIRALLD